MHGQVHVVVGVVLVVVVVVIVQGGQVLQRGDVRRWGQPGDDDGVVYPALWGRRRVVAGTWGDEQGGLYCLRGMRSRGRRVGLGRVLWGWAHSGPFSVIDGFRRWADPLP